MGLPFNATCGYVMSWRNDQTDWKQAFAKFLNFLSLNHLGGTKKIGGGALPPNASPWLWACPTATVMCKYLAFTRSPISNYNAKFPAFKEAPTAILMCKYLAFKGSPTETLVCKYLAFTRSPISNYNAKFPAFKEAPTAILMCKYLVFKGSPTETLICKYLAFKGAPTTVMCKYYTFKGVPNNNCNMYVHCFQRDPQKQLQCVSTLFIKAPHSNCNV